MANAPVVTEDAPAPETEAPETEAPVAGLVPDDGLAAWQEAVMLWLSWNSTYEKLTARMCKEGQNQSKIEAMMDEMDQLRIRAIEKSESLMG